MPHAKADDISYGNLFSSLGSGNVLEYNDGFCCALTSEVPTYYF